MNKVSANIYKALLRAITGADAQVNGILTAWLAGRSSNRREAAARAVEIQRVLSELGGVVTDEAPRVAEVAYEQVRRMMNREPVVKLFDASITNFSNVHQNAVGLLADNLKNQLGEAITTLGRRSEDSIRRHGLRVSAETLASEQMETLGATKLARRLRDDGMTAFVDKRGARWSLSNYAEMAVRTTIGEAQSQATVNSMLSRGMDLVEFRHPKKVDHDHDECDEFMNRVFSLTGRTLGYPVLERLSPFHPKCDHFPVPSTAGVSGLLAAAA